METCSSQVDAVEIVIGHERTLTDLPDVLRPQSASVCRNGNEIWSPVGGCRTVVGMADIDAATLHTAEFWDERYAGRDAVWSGKVNQRLQEQTDDLTPGDALDLGCGEGGDAVWLAQRGWRVTAVDVSAVVIEKARTSAAEILPGEVAGRITWHPADVRTWQPPADAFDLVSMQFIHLTEALLPDVQARLAVSVRPGGVLLIVNHDPLDLQTTLGRPNIPGIMLSAATIVATLDPALWQVDVAEPFPRPFTDPEGRPITIHDTVVRAVRSRS
jgi:SAM-dependent methyltransferase